MSLRLSDPRASSPFTVSRISQPESTALKIDHSLMRLHTFQTPTLRIPSALPSYKLTLLIRTKSLALLLTMVTVKKVVPVESAHPANTQQWDFDHFSGLPSPHDSLVMPRQQPPWSYPGPVDPQERYINNFLGRR